MTFNEPNFGCNTIRFHTSERLFVEDQVHQDGDCENQLQMWDVTLGRVAPVVKITEAVGDIVVMLSVHVQFIDPVVDILTNLDILGGGSTSFILVSRNIDPE